MSARPTSAGRRNHTIDVYVISNGGIQQLVISPSIARMAVHEQDVKVKFHLKKKTRKDHWAFLPRKQSDWDFYGIQITGGDDGQFYDAGCESGSGPRHNVWVHNQNTINHTYKYSVTVFNTKTGQQLCEDPSIVNRSDTMTEPGARL